MTNSDHDLIYVASPYSHPDLANHTSFATSGVNDFPEEGFEFATIAYIKFSESTEDELDEMREQFITAVKNIGERLGLGFAVRRSEKGGRV